MRWKLLLLVQVAAWGMTGTLWAGPLFIPLGALPGNDFHSMARAVSADGTVVVGVSRGEAFRWTQAGGMVGLGDLPGGSFYSIAFGVSADGSVVVGQGWASGFTAFRWTSAGGMVSLGVAPDDDPARIATAVSADGSVVAGVYGTLGDPEAFLWTSTTGVIGLDDPSGPSDSIAYGISADGTTVVGERGLAAFRWTSGGGMQSLGTLPNGSGLRSALAVSADGSVIVGEAPLEAFRWTSTGGAVGLGQLNGHATRALGLSADGTVVVGSNGELEPDREAFRWTDATGMQSIEDIITAAGLGSAIAGWQLQEAWGVSADGRTIVGYGLNPLGQTEAWVVVVPEPSSIALAASGALLILALHRRRRTAK